MPSLAPSSNNDEYRCSLTIGDPDARLMDWIAQSEYVYKDLVLLNEFVSHLGTIRCTAEYRIGGVTFGFAVIFKDVPLHEVGLSHIYFLPEHRGKGLCTEMLRKLDRLAESHFERVFVDCEGDNVTFFSKHGFRPFGVQGGFIQMNRQPGGFPSGDSVAVFDDRCGFFA